jgi:hypothetical protein
VQSKLYTAKLVLAVLKRFTLRLSSNTDLFRVLVFRLLGLPLRYLTIWSPGSPLNPRGVSATVSLSLHFKLPHENLNTRLGNNIKPEPSSSLTRINDRNSLSIVHSKSVSAFWAFFLSKCPPTEVRIRSSYGFAFKHFLFHRVPILDLFKSLLFSNQSYLWNINPMESGFPFNISEEILNYCLAVPFT